MSASDPGEARGQTKPGPGAERSAPATGAAGGGGAGGASSSGPSFAVAPPTVSLPRGGGAIGGIGEKFAANPVTGTGSLSVPIATSPGRQGFGPELALSYDSGAGNGIFGLGWQLSLPSIARKTDKGLPRYRDADESDVFVLAGAEDLVPALDAATGERPPPTRTRTYGHDYLVDRYRPRIEGSFALIERWTRAGDPTDVAWRTIGRDNVTTWFGRTPDSRVVDPADPRRIFRWSICERHDDKGNAVVYGYAREDGRGVDRTRVNEANRPAASLAANTYPKRIRYGNAQPFLPTMGGAAPAGGGAWATPDQVAGQAWMFEVVFDYGDHPGEAPTSLPTADWTVRADPFSSHRSGFEVRTLRLCRRVLLFHHFPGVDGVGADCLVRSTDLDHRQPADLDDPEQPGYTTLAAVVHRSYRRRAAPATGYDAGQHPPLTFTYSEARVDPTVRTLPPEALENVPVGPHGPGYQFVDLDGEGMAGVLSEQAGAWYYKANQGDGRFAPLRLVATVPAMASLATGRQQLVDLAGDGALDLVDLRGPAPGFHLRADPDDGVGAGTVTGVADRPGWTGFVPFRSLPNVDWDDDNLRFVDLTGDGRADVLVTDDEALTWYGSLAEDGYAPAERVATPAGADDGAGPRVVFADGTQTMFLADMTGDGLTDLVRVRNRDVGYWPSLGYGAFGPKVTLAHAPAFDHDEAFDPRRVRLADVDGSGPADLVYLGRDGARLYLNRSGDRLSDGLAIALPVAPDDTAGVQPADLLGDGTACLVWSSALPADTARPVRYVRLVAIKPHLLVGLDNNLGGTTEIEYTPSTRFSEQDRSDGRPWATRLPFPVHCVSRVTVRDKWRGTAFSSTYSYHHGHYDGDEREMRGFGRVEQVDVEAYGTFAAGNPGSPFVTSDRSLYQPPVKTITWFDTGAVGPDRARVADRFASEGFAATHAVSGFVEKAADRADPLPGLSDAEWREAARAGKGQVLRQEVYELDVDDLTGSAHRQRPVRLWSVATRDHRVDVVQPRGPNRHAVFLVTERESLVYQHDLPLPAAAATAAGAGAGASVEPDPRITHTLALSHDVQGNPQQTVTVGYGRGRTGLPAGVPATLAADDVARIERVQSEAHVTYAEVRYTDDVVVAGPAVPGTTSAVRHHRLRLPAQTRTYELTGITIPASGYLDVAGLQAHALCADGLYPPQPPVGGTAVVVGEVGYHQQPPATGPTRRLVGHTVSRYFRDDDGIAQPQVAHPIGTHGPRGLKYEDYRLALTPGLLDAVFRQPDPVSGAVDDKLGWTLDAGGPPVRDLLGDPAVSGYVAGATLDPAYTGQLWVASGRAGYAADAATTFYLAEEYVDPFGNPTHLAYDGRNLYVESSTDAGGNTVRVGAFDFRLLAPRELVDANGNHTEVAFDVVGHLVASATKGKPRPGGGWQGDDLDTFTAALSDLDPVDVGVFCTADVFDETTARAWLGRATTRYVRHFGERRDPVTGAVTWADRMGGACAIARERHAHDAPAGTGPLQVSLACSDGTGGVLMTKVRAEPDPAVAGGPVRWVVNGRTVLNNKGLPVKQYEPAFTDRFGAQLPPVEGVTSVLYYDTAGRVLRTEHPDGTVSRVEPSPWAVRRFDQNDTVLTSKWYETRDQLDPAATLPRDLAGIVTADPEQRAGWLSARHADTPTVTVLDSLGRTVVALAHNRVEAPTGPLTYDGRTWRDVHHATRTHVDPSGRPLWVRDARGNLVVQHLAPPRANDDPSDTPLAGEVPGYDIAGNLLFEHGMDTGSRWTLPDAAGQPLLAWDHNDHRDINATGPAARERRLVFVRYDALHRPIERWLRIDDEPRALVEVAEHADTTGLAGAALTEARERNLIGQRTRHYDASGLATLDRIDLDGAVEEVTRTLVGAATADLVDWDVADRGALLAQDGGAPETFRQITEHDALGRPTTIYNWHRDRPAEPGQSSRVAVLVPRFNARGLLESEQLHLRATKQTGPDGRRTFTPEVSPGAGRSAAAVSAVTWNAKGQKLTLALGNGTTTRYTYDPATFRLVHLYTRRDSRFAGDCAADPDIARPVRPCGVQNLHFTYDAAGTITHVHDDAQDTIWFANQQVEPSADYVHDALGRLTEAAGRENAAAVGAPPHPPGAWPTGSFPAPGATRRHTERYRYDAVGNVEQVRHEATGGNWTRNHTVAADSNRLVRTWYGTADWDGTPGAQRTAHRYDEHGNLLNLAATAPGLDLRWNRTDMLGAVDLLGGGWAVYQHDVDRQRTRKRLEHGGTTEERVYLGGYERYRRWVGTTLVEEIESTHLFEGDQRVLLVDDVLTSDDAALDDRTVLRYQYGNHLGTVGTELDAEARVISHEEMHPYGTTAWRMANSAVEAPPRRYRYTAMETDAETGLSYHSARYYAPSLVRWCSPDPAGITAGLDLYAYAANPTGGVDRTGTEVENTDNKDDFETVQRKAVLAWSSGTDEKDRRQRFAAEIHKKYPFGMSGKHAWQMWGSRTAGMVPVEDIWRATDGDDLSHLMNLIVARRWLRTFDELFVPGVPVNKEALLKASGATAKVVELYLSAPRGGPLPGPPSSFSGPSMAPALGLSVETAVVEAGVKTTVVAMSSTLPEGTHSTFDPDEPDTPEETPNDEVERATEARERAEFRDNMREKWGSPSQGEQDHHIVPYKGGGALGDEARQILEDVGLSTKDAANGVRLNNPQSQTGAAGRGPNTSNVSHGNVHTKEEWEQLLEYLRPAAGDLAAVEEALQRYAARFF